MVRLVEAQARSDRQMMATLIASGRYDGEIVSVSQRRAEFDELLLADVTVPAVEDDRVRLHRILGLAS